MHLFQKFNLSQFRRRPALWGNIIAGVFILALGGYGVMYFKDRQAEWQSDRQNLEQNLTQAEEENKRLEQELRDKLYIIESFEGQIRSISGVVGDLHKLSQMDKELLRKYSKVYFLSENYVPARLGQIEERYTFNPDNKLLFHADALPYLNRLLERARAGGIELLASSAFRSFDTQASLKSSYTVVYGAGTANQFSADQGYSEHQLGTAVDLATRSSGPSSNTFEKDPAYQWLLDNAHRHGFTLSYPKGNSHYIFEPWHWRFVGVELATRLHAGNKHFYDMDQREIDEYLIKLFD